MRGFLGINCPKETPPSPKWGLQSSKSGSPMGSLKTTTMTTSIVFDHRGRTQKGRPGPLEVKISIQKKKWFIATGIKVLKQEWKHDEVVNRPDSPELNERLEIILKAVADEVNERLRSGLPVDVSEIRKAVWCVRVSDCEIAITSQYTGLNEPFLDWWEERVQMLGLSAGTLKHYKTTLAHIRACGYINRWRDLTTENIYRFDAYLHGLRIGNSVTRANGKEVALTQGTIHNQHKNLKAMIKRAVNEGLVESNPYEKLKGAFARGDVETVDFLTIEELNRMEGMELSAGGMLAMARDLFVFQAYTGMAFSDMQAFKLSECRCDDGRWLVAKQRVKTGVPYYVQLLPPALAVVQKYGGVMPQVVGQVYNRALKDLAAMAGIQKRVTSHVARHTFATWMLHEEVPIERVAKMLGHSNIRQTQRYAKVLAEDVYAEFERFAGNGAMESLGKKRNKGKSKSSGR